MREIKINTVNANGTLTQYEYDTMVARKNTINLSKRLNSKQIKEVRVNRTNFNTTRSILKGAVLPFIGFLVLVIGTGILTSTEANYEGHERFLAHFPLETRVIGCYNSNTKETREGYVCTKPGDKNIKLPARSQIVTWLKYYSENQILNRLALVNFESGFNIHASNSSAKGYVQTLRSHNVAIDIDSQLSWMKNREEKTYAKISYAGKYGQVRGCAYYWNNTNFKDGFAQGEYGVLSCMYRYHYDANKGSWYAKKGIAVTKFYKYYMFGIK